MLVFPSTPIIFEEVANTLRRSWSEFATLVTPIPRLSTIEDKVATMADIVFAILTFGEVVFSFGVRSF